jgi:assimilatory nitrate reductase catalytic subunit
LGKVGRPNSGYGCLTGQGNGQGGREHGQKADQLPGYRRIDVPEHREAVAKIWGVDASSLPGKGKSAYELCDALGPKGGIHGLLIFGSNLSVASPGSGHIDSRLRDLDLLVVCDSFMNETAQHASFFLPVTQWAEEEGTMTNLEGRVIRRRKAFNPPTGVMSDINILCALAGRLGKGHTTSITTPRKKFSMNCAVQAAVVLPIIQASVMSGLNASKDCSGLVPLATILAPHVFLRRDFITQMAKRSSIPFNM